MTDNPDDLSSAKPAGPAGLMLDRPVPSFIARSTKGQVSSDDYRGKWLILFSHPADFTPVCTSEFIALERSIKEFEKRNCQLLGLSVDSIYSHVAWLSNIREKFGVEVSFPVIEDISMSIASAFGMLDSNSLSTATVRSVFFIDPQGILRANIHYPMQVGRSVSEIIRTLSALQSVDEHGMSAPEGWHVGEKLVPMAPTTLEEANRIKAVSENVEWYYTDTSTSN